MIIAIDGPAAAGKGTLAKRLAGHFGFAHLDTGALYRAVALTLLRADKPAEDETAAVNAAETLDVTLLSDPDLRTDPVAGAASKVAAQPPVRDALLRFQQSFAAAPPDQARGAVLDGRDVGTVVCPEADVKLFVTASDEERARRRVLELQSRGLEAIYGTVLQELRARDARDRARSVAPLKPAEDAVILDTSALDADTAFERALIIVERIRENKARHAR